MDDSDPYSIDPGDIEPIGATIAVAFTGAAIGLVGAAVSFVAVDFGVALVHGAARPAGRPARGPGVAVDFGVALIGVGVVVALSSPIAYVRMKRLRGE